MANIPIGTKAESQILVTNEVAIDFMGTEGARVLSTPHMIGYMERTCRDTVLPLLDAGCDTVGTHVNVWHVAAAPIGMSVTFTAEITGRSAPKASRNSWSPPRWPSTSWERRARACSPPRT